MERGARRRRKRRGHRAARPRPVPRRGGSSGRPPSAERGHGRPSRDPTHETLCSPGCSPGPSRSCFSDARGPAPDSVVTYSPKVFIPLTKLCRDVCHYCTFARPPRRGERAYLTRRGARRSPAPVPPPAATRRCSRSATSRSCATASRARSSRRSAARRRSSTWHGRARSSSRRPACSRTLNSGVMSADELDALRAVSASQGIMLETARTGSSIAAARTSARRTSAGGAPRDARGSPASSRSRSRPGS